MQAVTYLLNLNHSIPSKMKGSGQMIKQNLTQHTGHMSYKFPHLTGNITVCMAYISSVQSSTCYTLFYPLWLSGMITCGHHVQTYTTASSVIWQGCQAALKQTTGILKPKLSNKQHEFCSAHSCEMQYILASLALHRHYVINCKQMLSNALGKRYSIDMDQ